MGLGTPIVPNASDQITVMARAERDDQPNMYGFGHAYVSRLLFNRRREDPVGGLVGNVSQIGKTLSHLSIDPSGLPCLNTLVKQIAVRLKVLQLPFYCPFLKTTELVPSC